ncbi:MAG TPA: hypothetical protein VGL17_02085, partial [Gemmatimonadaceae bacterium]
MRTPLLPGAEVGENPNWRQDVAQSAVRALEKPLSDVVVRLQERANGALGAPFDVPGAFSLLATRAPQRDNESVVLFDNDAPLAWAGKIRIDPDSINTPVSVTFRPFYTTLNVVQTKGGRRAVASVVLHAA